MSTAYSAAFKENIVRRLVGPGAISATALAEELGLPQPTLSRWLREARTVAPMASKKNEKKSPRDWTPLEKLRVVAAAEGLKAEQLGEFLRREGIHEQQLDEWREAATAALSAGKPRRAQPSLEAKRIKALEAELHRKEKALAEAAALLVLKKKVQAIWGEEDDSTDGKNGK